MSRRYLTIDDVELSNVRCETCIYFTKKQTDARQRFCSRYPHTHPLFVAGENSLNHTRPPKVLESMRCGEWKSKATRAVAKRMTDK